MKDIVGQISLFDMASFMGYRNPIDAPVMLNTEQKVFIVVRGDVVQYSVINESWVCGKDNFDRGYRLKHERGTYSVTWNSSIGVSCFLDFESASNVAEAYLKDHDVIMAESIRPIKTVAYSYTRDDNRNMIAFYSELDNGMVYIKEFITFHHIVNSDKKSKAIKRFMEQPEFEHNDVKLIDYKPVFKNMYRIKQKYDWDYAEAGHSYATG